MQEGRKNREELTGSEEKKRVHVGKGPRAPSNPGGQHCDLPWASRSMRHRELLPSQRDYSSVTYSIFQNDCQTGLIFSIPL